MTSDHHLTKYIFLIVLMIGAAACQESSSNSKSSGASIDSPDFVVGVVNRVVDGDSIYLSSYDHQIRLWGVDAPERDEPFYVQSTKMLVELVKNKKVKCFRKDTDKYGRFVGHCFLVTTGAKSLQKYLDDRTLDVNRAQVESDYADEYCFFTKGFFKHC